MSNEEVRQFQWGLIMVVSMNGPMALMMKYLGLPPEWWVMMLMVAIFSLVMLLCIVMIRGYMPKDKLDWDNFAVYCHKHAKDRGDI